MGQQWEGLAGLHGEVGPHTPFSCLPLAWCCTVGGGGGGGTFSSSETIRLTGMGDRGVTFTSTETRRLIGDGTTTGRPCMHTWRRWAPHTLLLPSSCMVLYWRTGGDLCLLRNHKAYWNYLYILRNHKAYWECGTGGDLYVHRNQRRIGDGGQGVTLHPQKP